MRTYLLLGGAGFLGANLACELCSSGSKVVILERPGADLSRIQGAAEGARVYLGHLSDTAEIGRIIDSEGVGTVVHLVSGLLPSSDFARYESELRDVVAPTMALLRLCSAAGVRFVFFSSGGAIYGDSEGEALREDHPLAPISYYGLSKVQIEQGAQFEGRRAGLEYLIVRPSNPFGRFQRLEGNQGLVSIALGRMTRGEAIDIWGDGSIVRDYVDVGDLMSAVARLMESGARDGIFNVGMGSGVSVTELIAILEEATGRKAALRFLPGRSVDVRNVVLDVSRLRSAIDYRPMNLKAAIEKYCSSIGVSRGE